jgi:PAS domain S-box-containing protein
LALLAASVLYLLYRTQDAAVVNAIRGEESKTVEVGRQRVEAIFGTALSDIGYFSDQVLLHRWLESPSSAALGALADDYLAFAVHQPFYDQIRLLDLDGRELLRIARSGVGYEIVPKDQLRKSTDGYYFPEIARLKRGQIYVSPFDLTTGGTAIRQPIVPTIRFATPLFDARGLERAILILNYEGARAIDRLNAVSDRALGSMWLVNADGYWLKGPSPDDEWAFMYPDRQRRSFKRSYPGAWKQIRKGRNVTAFVSKGSLFTYAWVDVVGQESPDAAQIDSRRVVSATPTLIVARVSPETVAGRLWPVRRNVALAGIFLALLFAVVAWAAARHWTSREESEEAVRRSEARFRGFMEAAPDAVVVTDASGAIVFANRQTERLFGYRSGQMIGCPIEILIPERYRARHVTHRASYLAAPRVRRMGAGMELFGLKSDGSEFPLAVHLSPVETKDGAMIYADIRDITEHLEAQRKIEELNRKLSRDNLDLQVINREMEAFSYSVSHDLRAPLRAIDGFSQAISEDCADQLDALGRNYLVRIRGAAQRMGMLIDDLLKLSRVTRGELHVSEIDLSALARDVGDALRGAAPDRQVDVAIEPGLKASADSHLIRIVLENLIGNAWKFTSKCDRPRIEFGYLRQMAEPTYFVRDNGAGFDMAYANKLFGAFQRLHDATSYPGTGIGLATVQRIIHKHGGRIWAQAEINRGATFYFTLQPGGEGVEA